MTEATAGPGPDFDQHPELDRAVESRLRPEIRPRSAWGEGHPPVGRLEAEDDVRFLIVHHTASANDYGPAEVVEQIHDIYDLHVGPERGWADVAYNFLIDRFGGIWEARDGSLEGAVRNDATGGFQGFAQLASLIGNHVEAPPTPEAIESLTRLLAWMAHRHRVDTTPGTTVVFPSRGSDRWPAGAEVTAATISGHRDMSVTACPGDSVYDLLDRSIPEEIVRLRRIAFDDASAQLGVDPSSGSTPSTIGSESVAAGTDGVEALDAPRIEQAGSPRTDADHATDDGADRYLLSAGATMVVASLSGMIALRRRRIDS